MGNSHPDLSEQEAIEFGYRRKDYRVRERQAYMMAEMEDIKSGKQQFSSSNAGERSN